MLLAISWFLALAALGLRIIRWWTAVAEEQQPTNTRSINYFCLDIETVGVSDRHPILAVGVAVVSSKKEVLVKRIYYVPFRKTDFEKKSYDEFWSNPENHEKFIDFQSKENEIDYDRGSVGDFYRARDEAFKDMKIDIDRILSDYAPIVMIGDNVDYDYGYINEQFNRLGRPILNFVPKDMALDETVPSKGYRFNGPVLHTSSYYQGIMGVSLPITRSGAQAKIMEEFNIKLPDGVVHNHYPDDDSVHTALIFVSVCEAVRERLDPQPTTSTFFSEKNMTPLCTFILAMAIPFVAKDLYQIVTSLRLMLGW